MCAIAGRRCTSCLVASKCKNSSKNNPPTDSHDEASPLEAGVLSRCKTESGFTQEQHHCAADFQQLSSPDDGKVQLHKCRSTNVASFSATTKPKIKFPPAPDPRWNVLNQTLSPKIARTSTSLLAEQLMKFFTNSRLNNSVSWKQARHKVPKRRIRKPKLLLRLFDRKKEHLKEPGNKSLIMVLLTQPTC